MFGLFKKHCPICQMAVDKEKGIKRFGEYFCSEGHAEEYRQNAAKEKSQHTGHGNCCH